MDDIYRQLSGRHLPPEIAARQRHTGLDYHFMKVAILLKYGPFQTGYSELTTDADRVRYLLSDECINSLLSKLVTQFSEHQAKSSKVSRKSTELAAKYREEGNRFYATRGFGDAVTSYSDAILQAPEGEELALAYGNRSGAFLQLQQYEDALKDIDAALGLEYGKYKPIFLLITRKCECLLRLGRVAAAKELLDSVKSSVDSVLLAKLYERVEDSKKVEEEEPKKPESLKCITSVIKMLTEKGRFDPQEKIPYLSTKVEVRYDEKNGRHLVTTSDVNFGDILAVTKPYASVLTDELELRLCHHCLAALNCFPGTFSRSVPCSHCTRVLYCSEQCRTESWNLYHYLECSILPLSFKTCQFFHLSLRALITSGGLDSIRSVMEKLKKNDDEDPDHSSSVAFDFTDKLEDYANVYRMKAEGSKDSNNAVESKDSVERAIMDTFMVCLLVKMAKLGAKHEDDDGAASPNTEDSSDDETFALDLSTLEIDSEGDDDDGTASQIESHTDNKFESSAASSDDESTDTASTVSYESLLLKTDCVESVEDASVSSGHNSPPLKTTDSTCTGNHARTASPKPEDSVGDDSGTASQSCDKPAIDSVGSETALPKSVDVAAGTASPDSDKPKTKDSIASFGDETETALPKISSTTTEDKDDSGTSPPNCNKPKIDSAGSETELPKSVEVAAGFASPKPGDSVGDDSGTASPSDDKSRIDSADYETALPKSGFASTDSDNSKKDSASVGDETETASLALDLSTLEIDSDTEGDDDGIASPTTTDKPSSSSQKAACNDCCEDHHGSASTDCPCSGDHGSASPKVSSSTATVDKDDSETAPPIVTFNEEEMFASEVMMRHLAQLRHNCSLFIRSNQVHSHTSAGQASPELHTICTLDPLISAITTSCMPNVSILTVDGVERHESNVSVIFAIQPIPRGTVLSTLKPKYGDWIMVRLHMHWLARLQQQKSLQGRLEFNCACSACAPLRRNNPFGRSKMFDQFSFPVTCRVENCDGLMTIEATDEEVSIQSMVQKTLVYNCTKCHREATSKEIQKICKEMATVERQVNSLIAATLKVAAEPDIEDYVIGVRLLLQKLEVAVDEKLAPLWLPHNGFKLADLYNRLATFYLRFGYKEDSTNLEYLKKAWMYAEKACLALERNFGGDSVLLLRLLKENILFAFEEAMEYLRLNFEIAGLKIGVEDSKEEDKGSGKKVKDSDKEVKNSGKKVKNSGKKVKGSGKEVEDSSKKDEDDAKKRKLIDAFQAMKNRVAKMEQLYKLV